MPTHETEQANAESQETLDDCVALDSPPARLSTAETRPVVVDQDEPDPFEALFACAEETDESVVVQLRRTGPKTTVPDPVTGAPVSLAGYLEDLPPGLSSYEGYVAEKWGGGKYLAQRKLNGQIKKNASFEIGGVPPKITPTSPPPPPKPKVETESNAGKPVVENGPTIRVGKMDVPLSASMQQIQEMAIVVKSLEQMFPEKPVPPDINAELLKLLMERDQNPSNPLDSFHSVIGLVESVKGLIPESAGGGEGGASWKDIIDKGITALNGFIEANNSGRQVRPQSPRPPHRAPGTVTAALPAPAATTVNTEPNPTTDQIQESPEMSAQPTKKEIAAMAVANIVAHFIEARTEPAEVVQLLDNIVPLSKEDRGQLVPFKGMLKNMGVSQISEYRLDDPQYVKDWPGYFGEVFDLFTNPEREALVLE